MQLNKTFPQSRRGKRIAIILLSGVVAIELFAIGQALSYLANGFQTSVALPVIILIALALTAPLLMWNLGEELTCCVSLDDTGLTYQSWLLSLRVPWAEVRNIKPLESGAIEPEDDRIDKLVVERNLLTEITNPVVRLLHWQAQGRYQLPLYPGLENRAELLEEIKNHLKQDQLTQPIVEKTTVSPVLPEPEA